MLERCLTLSFLSSTSFGQGVVLSLKKPFIEDVEGAGKFRWRHRYLEIMKVPGLCSTFVEGFS